MAKIKRYTEGILVRVDKKLKKDLVVECRKISLEQAIYGRKAIELCVRKHLIDHHKN